MEFKPGDHVVYYNEALGRERYGVVKRFFADFLHPVEGWFGDSMEEALKRKTERRGETVFPSCLASDFSPVVEEKDLWE